MNASKCNKFCVVLSSANLDSLKMSFVIFKKLVKLPNFKSVSLPVRAKRFSFLRSPHVNSKSKEHFKLVTHRRIFFFEIPFNLLFYVLKSLPNDVCCCVKFLRSN